MITEMEEVLLEDYESARLNLQNKCYLNQDLPTKIKRL